MNIYLFHLATLFVAIFIAYLIYIRTLRTKAKFALYKVRDEFIYHVACDKIKEDSKFFEFFYDSINALLREAPHVGIDDIIKAVPQQSGRQRKLKEGSIGAILADPAMDDEEIRKTVSCFFNAITLMILSHSSLTRLFYTIAIRVVAPVMRRINMAVNQHVAAAAVAAVSALFIVPGAAKRGLNTINYVENIRQNDIHAHI